MYIHNVPSVFSNYNPLVNFIDEMIDWGRKDIFSLREDEKDKVVSLLMDAMDTDKGYVVFENDDFSDNCDIFKNTLKTNSITDMTKFVKSLRDSSFKHYSDILQEIFYHLESMRCAA